MLTHALLALAAVPCSGPTGCTVQAEVEGRDLPLLVDTGADLTVLTAAGARRAGVRVPADAPVIVIRGAGGRSTAKLAFAEISVGEYEEPDVLVAVMDDLDLGGRSMGLLGMTFLERFRARVGRQLELEPVDADDRARRGGRGPSWWRLRFREFGQRKPAFERAIRAAKKADRQTRRTYGRDPSGRTITKSLERLKAFLDAAERRLKNEAARHAVPRAWRR